MATTERRTFPEDTAARATGRVQWFSHKGFGYIRSDDGLDVYVHHSAIMGSGFRTLPTDARVSFVIVASRRGPEAADVAILDAK
ncbi:MAG TPA: cold shock domain-containing protein [Euzebyales bacterium]